MASGAGERPGARHSTNMEFRMFKWWVLGCIALLFVGEAWVFLTVTAWLGLGWGLGWILVSFLLGLMMLRIAGVRLLFKVHRQLQAGNLPTSELLDGTMILVSALLLAIPGYLTDGIGIVLLLPLCRRLVSAPG